MRQLLPALVNPIEPARVYADRPVPSSPDRPGVRCNMIASADGGTAVAGRSGGLGGTADHRVFRALRSLADVVLVGAGTARAEQYGPSDRPVAVITRSCHLDWDSAFYTEQKARPIVITC